MNIRIGEIEFEMSAPNSIKDRLTPTTGSVVIRLVVVNLKKNK